MVSGSMRESGPGGLQCTHLEGFGGAALPSDFFHVTRDMLVSPASLESCGRSVQADSERALWVNTVLGVGKGLKRAERTLQTTVLLSGPLNLHLLREVQ